MTKRIILAKEDLKISNHVIFHTSLQSPEISSQIKITLNFTICNFALKKSVPLRPYFINLNY
jgi:hypothetical protein